MKWGNGLNRILAQTNNKKFLIDKQNKTWDKSTCQSNTNYVNVAPANIKYWYINSTWIYNICYWDTSRLTVYAFLLNTVNLYVSQKYVKRF